MSFSRKAGKFFRGISAVLRNPALFNTVLDQEDEHKAIVIKKYSLPDGLPELPFEFFFRGNEIQVKAFAFLDGGSLPTDLALLKLIALKLNAETYFEIGTWRGESVTNVADVVTHCFTLNLSSAQMRERGWDEKYINLHGHFSKKNPAIKHLEGDSRSFDFSNWKKKIDLMFVDGDHHYDSVVQDTKTAFELLKNENSVIVWHDYGNSPESVRWNVLHAILEGTPEHLRKHLYCVSNTLCAVYFKDAPSSHKRVYPKVPDTWFSVDLKKHSG